MKTYPECIPCLLRQALTVARTAALEEEKQYGALQELSHTFFNDFDRALSPPEFAVTVHSYLTSLSGVADPYAEVKEKSNREALAALPQARELLQQSSSPLKDAVLLSIAGNIIDFGIHEHIDIAGEIDKILKVEKERIPKETGDLFEYELLFDRLEKAKSILFLGDNAGEIVFDRLLIEEILRQYPTKKISFAVRDTPIINDATVDDGRRVGLDKVSELISSGCRLPGTILAEANEHFLTRFNEADLIISKGQGNFESLADRSHKEVFFLFMAKCRVITDYLGCNERDIILTRWNREL